MTDAYTAKGTYTIGSGSGDVIKAEGDGNNYINVEKIEVKGNILANAAGAKNYIYANGATTSSIAGNISVTGSTTASNTIIFKTGGSIKGDITATEGKNIITFMGSSNTLDGDITSSGDRRTQNIITAEDIEFKNTSNGGTTISLSGGNTEKKNLITLQGSTTFTGNTTIKSVSTSSVNKKIRLKIS